MYQEENQFILEEKEKNMHNSLQLQKQPEVLIVPWSTRTSKETTTDSLFENLKGVIPRSYQVQNSLMLHAKMNTIRAKHYNSNN